MCLSVCLRVCEVCLIYSGTGSLHNPRLMFGHFHRRRPFLHIQSIHFFWQFAYHFRRKNKFISYLPKTLIDSWRFSSMLVTWCVPPLPLPDFQSLERSQPPSFFVIRRFNKKKEKRNTYDQVNCSRFIFVVANIRCNEEKRTFV